jgi:CheY-like chemotaxis protein
LSQTDRPDHCGHTFPRRTPRPNPRRARGTAGAPHRDFLPWRFSDGGRPSACTVSRCRRLKTCTIADIAQILACLIADVNMPAMTGTEVYRRLIDPRREIPTILVTAYPENVDRIRALNDGVVCYFRKPGAFTQLSRSVNERLKKIHDPACTAGKVN